MAIGMNKIFGGLMVLTPLFVGIQMDQINQTHFVSPAWASEVRRPPIDLAAPETIQTAIFAMG